MRWVTQRRPKIDRLASPWLIKRFVDPEAQFLFVPAADVRRAAIRANAIPFDLPEGASEAELVHPAGGTSFDAIRARFGIHDPAVARIATLVREADNDNLIDRLPEASGLRAISLGLAKSVKSDDERLGYGMVLYDALYQWAQKIAPAEEAARPVPLLYRALAGVDRWMSRSRERQTLSELAARMLSDGGLTREAARKESAKPFWRA